MPADATARARSRGQRVEILLTDDLDGSNIPTGKGETVPFALDGKSYEIDLRTRHAAAARGTPALHRCRPADQEQTRQASHSNHS